MPISPLFLKCVGAISVLLLSTLVTRAQTYTPGTDITAQLNAAIAAGTGGYNAGFAVIQLPAGVFYISSSVDLNYSKIAGAGKKQTFLVFKTDLGSGKTGFTGGNDTGTCEMDDLAIQGPNAKDGVPATGGAVTPGTVPNQMNGVHLYNDCILRRVAVNYFNSGVLVDGNHHKLDTVEAIDNYSGFEYTVSSDDLYFDDYINDCNLTYNGWAGITLDKNGIMGGSTLIRTNIGYEPYGLYLGTGAIVGSNVFLMTQFEEVGNADIADVDGTSNLSANHFTGCNGWGIYDSACAITSAPTSPAMRVGTFLSNIIHATASQGPQPSNAYFAAGLYGNEWTIDTDALSALVKGTYPGITLGAVNNTYSNHIQAGTTSIVIGTATKALTANEPVEKDTGRYQGVNPALGVNPVFGVSITPSVAVGEAVCIAQSGPVSIACPTTSTLVSNQLIKVNSSSQVIQASSLTDGQNLGLAVGGASGGVVNCWINVLR